MRGAVSNGVPMESSIVFQLRSGETISVPTRLFRGGRTALASAIDLARTGG